MLRSAAALFTRSGLPKSFTMLRICCSGWKQTGHMCPPMAAETMQGHCPVHGQAEQRHGEQLAQCSSATAGAGEKPGENREEMQCSLMALSPPPTEPASKPSSAQQLARIQPCNQCLP